MNVDQNVIIYVEKCEKREPIFVKDIKVNKNLVNARNIAFARLKEKGIIKKYEKGIYYKAKKTMFGELGIDLEKIIIKKYIQEGSKRKGYVTGPIVWNNWGITTQVPKRKWIASNEVKRNTDKKDLNVKLIKPKIEINEFNFKALQYLDVIAQIEQMQDLNEKKLFNILCKKLDEFDTQDLAYLIEYMTYYKKIVQRLTGALIEQQLKDTIKYNGIKYFINIRKNEIAKGKKSKLYFKNKYLQNINDWGLSY